MFHLEKRGISPIIASIFLIALAAVIGSLIFYFSASFIPDPVLLSGSPIEFACEQVNIKAALFQQDLEISNIGNVHLAGIQIKISNQGEIIPYAITQTIQSGKSIAINLNEQNIFIKSQDKISITPILQGETSEGKQEQHICNDQHSIQVQ